MFSKSYVEFCTLRWTIKDAKKRDSEKWCGRFSARSLSGSFLRRALFYDQTKERIVPFITWRISLLQLLTLINLTGPQINTTLSQVALEHRLAAAGTTHLEVETLLREHNTTIERLEAARHWFSEREQE